MIPLAWVLEANHNKGKIWAILQLQIRQVVARSSMLCWSPFCAILTLTTKDRNLYFRLRTMLMLWAHRLAAFWPCSKLKVVTDGPNLRLKLVRVEEEPILTPNRWEYFSSTSRCIQEPHEHLRTKWDRSLVSYTPRTSSMTPPLIQVFSITVSIKLWVAEI